MKDAIKRGIVKTVTNGVQISRRGRGYSKNELIQSGVTDIRTARKNKVPIDPFRTTVHEENIEKLKDFLSQKSTKLNTVKQKRPRKNTKQDS
jgi:ribosomal protein L13E